MNHLKIPLNSFENRYTIRNTIIKDLPALLRLETECWSESLRATADDIRQRIEKYPSGQCVLEIDEQIIGVIYSQRIQEVEALYHATSQTVSTLHQPDGAIVQLLAINVLPAMQYLGFGDQLLEFMLLYNALKTGVKRVVAVTLCKNYADAADIPIADYIRKRNDAGQLIDPILRFHEYHGAIIKGLVPNYRPHDKQNLGHGVLVDYDIQNRQSGHFSPLNKVETLPTEIFNEHNLKSIIEDSIIFVLGDGRKKAYSPKYPLREMGLDSLDLFGLRMLISQRLGFELDTTFFFQYSTAEAISAFFLSLANKPNSEIFPLPADPIGYELEHPIESAASTKLEVTNPEILRQPSDALDNSSIAVIGMSCRFPKGINNSAQFWEFLKAGGDAITEVPETRWNMDRYYDPDRERPGKISSRYGGFIENVDLFDAPFFNISPREAKRTDPQQRILLEQTWHALEHAGINPEALSETMTGVFVGIFSHDYEILQIRQNQDADYDAYFGTGNASSVAAGRIAYCLGLRGPAVSVDTACSSSLSAIHLACQSLRHKDCDMAIAAGINLILSPELSMSFSRAGMLSPDGRCKTYDASADGYVRSEGCGVIILKPLVDAIRDNDSILALIRGSAMNQDGSSNGLTAPNALAQEAVIRTALNNAGLEADDISYFEAHGTGTSLGDPVEMKAIESVYAKNQFGASETKHDIRKPLMIGSVKTNIGHTEAAAGIAGLIKIILSLQHNYIPPHLHYQNLNPLIDLDVIPAVIPVKGLEWKKGDAKPRRAAISSFGFSGTNVHVIIEEAPDIIPDNPNPITDRPFHILTLSAKTENSLKQSAEQMLAFFKRHPQAKMSDICFTSNTGRAHFPYRCAVVAGSDSELADRLSAHVNGRQPVALFEGNELKTPQIAFLFTGQGSQYIGMARELYHSQPVFRHALDKCHEILKGYLEKPIIDVMFNQETLLNQTVYTQPALFTVEYALAQLWKSWGITPQAVMGHSVGEYAAACIAGVFSLADGLKLISVRARLMQILPQNGAMVAVFADEQTVSSAIDPYTDKVSIAAFNGPESIVISGWRESVQKIVDLLTGIGVRAIPLNVSHAFHSPLMNPMLKPFRELAGDIQFHRHHQIDIISNVSGDIAAAEIAAPDYWVTHVRQPVKFAQSMETLKRLGYKVFVETGPKPVLLGMARQFLSDTEMVWLPSLAQGQSDWQRMLTTLAELYARGAKINWKEFDRYYHRRKISIPTYPFEKQRYWLDAPHKTQSTQNACEINRQTCGAARLRSGWQDWLYHIQWRESEEFKDQSALLADIESLSLAYIVQAFDKISENEVIEGQQQLFHRLSNILSQHNRTGVPDAVALFNSLTVKYPEAEAELTILNRCASQLSQVLCGSTNPIELLFPEADVTTAARLYEDSPTFGAMNRLLRKTIQSFLSTRKPGQPLRLLEIGAGTGGATAHILPILSATATEYLFTDIGSLFTTKAKERFKNYAFLQYKILDIEEDPVSQGFLPNSCDVVLAANVLHATTDLAQTLRNVKKLLCPGGMMILLEGTAPRLWLDLIFGLIDGWWKFKDHELRPDHPLLSVSKWRKVLDEVGFEHTDILSPDHNQGSLFEQAVITARNPGLDAKQRLVQHWLILADNTGFGKKLSVEMEQQGHRVTLVYAENTFFKPHAFEPLLKKTGAIDGIVHLWTLNAVADEHISLKDVEQSCISGCQSALYLIQSLVSLQLEKQPSLYLIHQAGQIASVLAATMQGLGKVIMQEHPEFHCRSIELDLSNHELAVSWLTDEFNSADHEEWISLKGGKRSVARLTKHNGHHDRTDSMNNAVFHSDRSYLITGGLGGLGLVLARHIASKGAKHLILAARHAASEQAENELTSLKRQGVTIHIVQADVSDYEQLAAVFDHIQPPLAGVIHTAGVFEDRLLIQHQWSLFEKLFAAKVYGSWNLHILTQKLPLDFFILFSSSTCLISSSGLGNYVAANAFMDALAHYRHSLKLPALSINWGPWSGIGMAKAVGDYRQNQWKTQGIEMLSPESAIECLDYLMTCKNLAQIGVMSVAWNQFLPQVSDDFPRFFEDFIKTQAQATQEKVPNFTEQMNCLPLQERKEFLKNHIRCFTAAVMGFDCPETLHPQQGFFQMGMDSLTSVELRSRLQKSLGCSLPSTIIFKYPTIDSLTDYIAGEILKLNASEHKVSEKEDSQINKLLEEVCQIPSENIDDSVSKELAELEALLSQGST